MLPALEEHRVGLDVVGARAGMLGGGINSTQGYITASSVFYDSVIISGNLANDALEFVIQAYKHGKPAVVLGDVEVFEELGLGERATLEWFSGSADNVVEEVWLALSYPTRFFNRLPTDDIEVICST